MEKGKKRPLKWLACMITIIVATNIAVFLNIPLLRQLLAVIFLTVLPGLSILFILKLNKLPLAERLVLTMGLSVAFLMFFGLFLNQICLFFGYITPLSTNFLTIALSLALTAMFIVAWTRNREAFSFTTFHIELNTRGKLCLLLPSFFPLLSVLGEYLLNTTNNNAILIAFLFLIPVSIVLIVLHRHEISEDTYPIAIALISIALLSMFWLRSEHILGHDVHLEYYLFHMTQLNQHWSILEHITLESSLSISLLPAIYQSLFHITAEEQLFKAVYVMICSFTSLSVYIMSKKYLGRHYAFLAALFFTLQGAFQIAAGIPRTSVAIFFVALSIIVLFHDRIPAVQRKGLFITFMAATIISHYSTTYIFFFMLFFVYLVGQILRKYAPSRSITLASVSLFFAFIFLWYSQLTEAPFLSGVSFAKRTLLNLNRFFVEELRSQEALLVVGGGIGEYPFLSHIHYVITLFSFALIGVGIIGTLIWHKRMLLAPQWENSNSQPLKARFEIEYFLIAVACTGLLLTMITLPFISVGYEMQRLYLQAVVILSTFFILGGIIFAKYCRISPYLIILLVLIPYGMFSTGVLYEVCGMHDKSWVLSSECSAYDYEFVREGEASAAQWLKEHMGEKSRIHAVDSHGWVKLISQGKISLLLIDHVAFFQRQEMSEYVYLSHNNVVNGKFMVGGEPYTMSDYNDTLMNKNKLYVNGGSEVYK